MHTSVVLHFARMPVPYRCRQCVRWCKLRKLLLRMTMAGDISIHIAQHRQSRWSVLGNRDVISPRSQLFCSVIVQLLTGTLVVITSTDVRLLMCKFCKPQRFGDEKPIPSSFGHCHCSFFSIGLYSFRAIVSALWCLLVFFHSCSYLCLYSIM